LNSANQGLNFIELHLQKAYSGSLNMDDTPRAFFEELRSGILKKRVGQIALAVVLAEAI